MTRPIYMDHQTTTPIDRDVLEAMMPYLTDQFGDPSSRSHAWGGQQRRQWTELVTRSPP
jgi:cysteine desulfurase